MNSKRPTARLTWIALLTVLALTLTACGDIRQGVSWPQLTVVDYRGETQLLVSYEHQIDLLDLNTGRQAPIRDAEGEIILGEENTRWLVNGTNFENAKFFTAPLDIDPTDETWLFPTYDNRLLEVSLEATVSQPISLPLTDGVIANAVIGDGLVYMPYRNRDVVALRMDDLSEEVFRVTTREGIWASPLLHDGNLFITSIDHFLYAVNATTGEPIWDAPVDLGGAITSTPVYYDGYLYVGSYSHKMYMIVVDDGSIAAEYEAANWIWGSPVIRDNIVYFTDLSGNIYAITADSFETVWAVQPSNQGFRAAPVVTDEFVIAASRGGMLYWLDRATGTVIHEREVEGKPELLSDILLVEPNEAAGINGMVIVASTDQGRLVAAFNLDNSLPLWVYGR